MHSRSETILQLLKAKTILLLSPCMAYSGKLNGEWFNVINTLASGKSSQLQHELLVLQAWSYLSTVECTGRVLGQLRSLQKQLKVWLGSLGLWSALEKSWVSFHFSMGAILCGLKSLDVYGFINVVFLTRRRIVRTVVQEQSLQTDLCGVSGNGRPFCCFLSDLPQRPRWCPCRL